MIPRDDFCFWRAVCRPIILHCYINYTYIYENWGCSDKRTTTTSHTFPTEIFFEDYIILYGRGSCICARACVCVYTIRNQRRPNIINGRRRGDRCSRNQMRNRRPLRRLHVTFETSEVFIRLVSSPFVLPARSLTDIHCTYYSVSYG